ncbi:unnamed protein product [Aureobasidium uvarum]|uniref:GPI anchored serine-threonine rich protein n=1 Tax=Aureobasidium uvarum TaxID=2773716 RepID=A0A9N8KBI9_9PEZI|nr:unnamed protein product [Aureobasidium uvarum]
MQFSSLALLAATFGIAAAQSSTTSAVSSSTSSCPAQNVLNLCVSQQTAANTQCGPTDYDCLCTGYTNLLVCYNQCPNDPNAFGASQNKVQYCQAASQYGSSAMSRQSQSQTQSATASVSSSLSSALSKASSSASAASSSASSVQSSASRSAASAASSASAAATHTGAASNMGVPAAGVLGMVLGAAALL